MVWVVGVGVVGVVVAALMAFLVVLVVVDRRRVGVVRTQLEACRAEAVRLEVCRARAEVRQEAAESEAERLRLVECELKATLAMTEQEKTRLDFELRQVALVASRVPLLEPRLEELAVARQELARADERIAELLPMAGELELRSQFVETLQRELSYRDERILGLEHRAEQLTALLAAADRVEADHPAAGLVSSDPAPSSPPTQSSPSSASSASSASSSPSRPRVGEALVDTLQARGVRSVAELSAFDRPPYEAADQVG